MAEVKLKNLLRLYKPRSKFDAVILAVHACLVERGFRCINSGEEVKYFFTQLLFCNVSKNIISMHDRQSATVFW